jgi:cytochrome P450
MRCDLLVVAMIFLNSTAVSWTLFAFACDKRVQNKLRAEARGMATSTPSMDELNSLPYLDMVVREAMRLYPPVQNTERVAAQDDVVPLSIPYTDTKGKVQHEIV